MSQKFDHPAKKVLVAGSGGTGKSTLAEELVRKHRAQWKFVYDHQGEFASRFNLDKQWTADALEEKVIRKGWICFDPLPAFPGRAPEGFSFFCQYVFGMAQHCGGTKILFCDELQMLTDNRTEPTELLTCIESGRRFQIDIFLVSSAPNSLHNRVLNGMTEVYVFNLTSDPAVAWLRGLGFDPDEVKSLDKFQYVHKEIRTGVFTRNFHPRRPTAQGGSPGPESKAN
jgi:hypothetical protein